MHDSTTHRKGETLPEAQNVYRAKVVMTFLKTGIPLSKVDCLADLRQLLEGNGSRLTDSRHLLDMIPFILQQERNETRTEIQDKCISVTYDGTTRQGEVLAVIVRFCVDWVVVQRLVRLHVLQKSMNAEELARELISVLFVMLGVKSDNLLGFMRDGASVNGAAMRTLSIMYPIAIDIRCLSHTLNLVGENSRLRIFIFLLLFGYPFSPTVPKSKLYGKSKQDKPCHLFLLPDGGANGRL